MRRVLLDASFLIRCAELHVDLYSEIQRVVAGAVELVALDRTIGELEGIATRATKEGRASKLALMLLRRKNVAVVPAEGAGDVDTLIVKHARAGDIVATQDMGLKRRLRAKRIPLLVLREKSHLTLVGE